MAQPPEAKATRACRRKVQMNTDSPVAMPLDPKLVVETILTTLAIPGTVEQSVIDGAPFLRITTPDPGLLIGKRGQTIYQLQFLVNRILQRHDLKAPRVTIDCENHRDQQNEEILRQAQDAAEKVRRWGEAVCLGPLATFDRQVIQKHFHTDRELEAISEPGEETGKKKIMIRVRHAAPVAR